MVRRIYAGISKSIFRVERILNSFPRPPSQTISGPHVAQSAAHLNATHKAPPAATPHAGQATEDNRFAVKSFFFI